MSTPQQPERDPVTEKAKGKRSGKRIIGGITAGAALVAGGAIIGTNLGDSGDPNRNSEPTAEAPAVPGPVEPSPSSQPTETLPTPTDLPTSIETTAAPEQMPEQLEQYEAMSLNEFRRLPVQERLQYASWLTRDHERFVDEWYGLTHDPVDRYPDTVSPDNTGQEILTIDGYWYRESLARHTDDNGEYIRMGIEHLEKIAAASFYDATGAGWDRFLEKSYDPARTELGSRISDLVAGSWGGIGTATGDRVLSGVTDADGNPLIARTVSDEYTNPNTGVKYAGEANFAYVEYTDYLGSAKSTWVQLGDR